ncbi:GtrA family protein [archaeon]|nr:GtrA family protein [archaeon]NCP79514.1 GtrA family protein [archaeon]NCP97457.1 GtrA family protein [archaeon]NCQ07281.1 GtrA family protein [archaeon]NCQ51077.1 GtrA family protein [archaeon]
MKQTKLSDFKLKKPSFFNSLIVYKKTSFIYKIYYWLMDFKLFYKNKKTLKYLVIGLSGEIIDFSFLLLFTEVFNIFYLLSAVIAYFFAIINNFFLNVIFTFKYKPLNKSELIGALFNYFLVSLFGFILSVLLIFVFVEVLNIYYLIGKVFSSIIVFIMIYTGHNFVFSRKKLSICKFN